jgi:hypothetical protein
MDYKDPIEVAKQLLAEENQVMVEAETILDLDDEQDTEGKKTKIDTDKGTKKQPEPKMKPSKASGKVETVKATKEHLDALFSGEELTEGFREKATTIFEAAINERADQVEAKLQEQYEDTLAEATASLEQQITERLDDYLGYVVEEWMSENEVAVESGIRTEVAEGFIHGLKDLFESSFIDVPEDQYDLVDGLSTEVEDLRSKLDEAVNVNIELSKDNLISECALVFEEETEGMLETEIDRLRTLAEGIEFDSLDQFKEKLIVLKESYSENTAPSLNEEDTTTPDSSVQEPSDISPLMERYTRALNTPHK